MCHSLPGLHREGLEPLPRFYSLSSSRLQKGKPPLLNGFCLPGSRLANFIEADPNLTARGRAAVKRHPKPARSAVAPLKHFVAVCVEARKGQIAMIDPTTTQRVYPAPSARQRPHRELEHRQSSKPREWHDRVGARGRPAHQVCSGMD